MFYPIDGHKMEEKNAIEVSEANQQFGYPYSSKYLPFSFNRRMKFRFGPT